MPTPLQQVQKLLPRLSAQERQELRLSLERFTAAEKASVQGNEDWFLPGIETELRRLSISHPPLTPEFIARVAPNYASDAPPVLSGLKAALQKHAAHHSVTPAHLLNFGQEAAQVLVSYLRSKNQAVGLKSLLVNVANLPEALDEAYPGYLAKGWLWLIVKP